LIAPIRECLTKRIVFNHFRNFSESTPNYNRPYSLQQLQQPLFDRKDELADIHRRLESLETPTKREPQEYVETQGKPGCMKKWVWVLITIASVVITAIATSYIVKGSESSDNIKPPPPTSACDKSLAFGEIYYGSNSVLAGTAHFEFSFQFQNRSNLTRADGAFVQTGDMYICYQTTGLHASGPGNCTNSFVYDEHTCELSTKLSDCQIQVQHQDTDLDIQWLEFDGANDQIKMDSTTHLPGWVGKTTYARSATNPIKCPAAKN